MISVRSLLSRAHSTSAPSLMLEAARLRDHLHKRRRDGAVKVSERPPMLKRRRLFGPERHHRRAQFNPSASPAPSPSARDELVVPSSVARRELCDALIRLCTISASVRVSAEYARGLIESLYTHAPLDTRELEAVAATRLRIGEFDGALSDIGELIRQRTLRKAFVLHCRKQAQQIGAHRVADQLAALTSTAMDRG